MNLPTAYLDAEPEVVTGQAFDLVRVARATPIRIKVAPKIIRPTVLAYTPSNRDEFSEPDFDLGECARALDTEALIRVSVDKHVTLCMKEGYKIVGKEPNAVAYIRKRLFEFELGTLIPFRETVRESTYNVVAFANAFLVYRRDAKLSSGRPHVMREKLLDPIAGIFNANPASMRIKRNKWGGILRYKQEIDPDELSSSEEKEFAREDVVHIAHNRRSGFAWGAPYMVSVLDDVRLLRNVEELVNMTIHKGTFPILHWKVGTEKIPAIDYQDGSSEITDVENEIRMRDAEGVFVTSERHEIDSIPFKTNDLSAYLGYFRNRVMTGLNLSTVDLGEGGTSNKATASEMGKAMQHKCKDFQSTVSNCFTSIFDELLIEGGFEVNEDTRVSLVFPEIDIETQQIVQNHAMALYQGHAITEDEMRISMGREPIMDSQRDNSFFNLIEKPRLLVKASVVGTSSSNSTTNKNRPSNQHGTKSAAGSRKSDALAEFRVREILESLRIHLPGNVSDIHRVFKDFVSIVDDSLDGCVSDEVLEKIRFKCLILLSAREDTTTETINYLESAIVGVLKE